MLNRRFLRIITFQALYSFFRDSDKDVTKAEKQLLKGIDKIYDLYLYYILLIVEIADAARNQIEVKKSKILATEEDLLPNTKFVENKVIEIIEDNFDFKRLIETKKLRWTDEGENIRKLLKNFQQSEDYLNYIQNKERSFAEDKQIISILLNDYIAEFELTNLFLEELNLQWVTDKEIALVGVSKTIQNIDETKNANSQILSSLFKSSNTNSTSLFDQNEDDIKFVKDLFRKCVQNASEYDRMIASNIKNWELDRVAAIDILLIKMAITEFEFFISVPPKVSMNEYIEISKAFSTPKSRLFINGILDKILMDLKKEGRVNKAGRGLIEN